MKYAALLFIGVCICPAQDARSLVAHAVAADDRSDRLSRSYTYKLRDEIRELDSSGRVKSVHSTLDEILYIGGKRYFHPLEKDEKPLPAVEARHEQAKLDRTVATAARLTDAEREKRIEDEERARAKSRAQFRDIPDAYDFKLIGETVIGGRDAYEISAVPRAGYHGPIRGVLQSLEGTLWIDKKDLSWVKFEVEVLKPFSLGWFLARVSDGTHLSYEMMRVNDELWVPKEISLKASARFVLLRKVNVEQRITFSDYRKFQTDSRILSAGENP
ncbi:MAG TPA: hypothetical protein VGL82_07905 [Bryobacteraceae bacterium]|jgi:hypothetical protein